MTRIGFATADWSALTDPPTLGGSGWYRVGLPAAEFARAGHDVVVGTLLAHNQASELGVQTWDGENHWDFDVMVLQRWMHEGLATRIRAAVAGGQVIVNDVDDWFFGLATTNRAYRTTHPRVSPEANTNHYRQILAASSVVTVSTVYLADRLEHLLGDRLRVVRNAIDLLRWPQNPLESPQSDDPVFGWVGAVSWRSGDLEGLRGVVGPFLNGRRLRFHHGGHLEGTSSAGEVLGVERHTEALMVPIAEYPELFTPLDVGLVPLSDRPFNLSKSAIKGMEYAAAGVPFVAADTPEYRWLADQGVGRLAKRPKEWLRHMEALLDPDIRAKEAIENRQRVESLDISRRWSDWREALAVV